MKTSIKTASRIRLSSGVAPIVLGLALASSPAFAQTAPAEDDSAERGIIVTGSRLARANLDSAAPVTVVSSEGIKEFGATKIEDLTNSLPQVFAGQSSGVSNGADGTATIDLRGLGPSRTVVLIDGRRLMPGGVGGGAGADLNFIPAALIQNFELLTGGASAAYGPDAVAGVVNFKMNRKFEGVRLDAQYGFFQHNNNNPVRDIVNQRFVAPEGSTALGGSLDVSLSIGTGFSEGRGSVVAYAGYREDQAISQDNYDYSICTLNPDAANVGFACGGSGTPERTRIGGVSAANAALAGIPVSGSYTLTSNNTLIPYNGLRDAFNFAPVNYFRRPSQRFIAGAFAEYEINDSFKPYLDVMFMDYTTDAQIAASGAFFGPRAVNCDNPFLTGNLTVGRAICGADLGTSVNANPLIGKRNVEGGPRFNDIGFNQFRVVAGMKGDIADGWAYEGYAQFGQIKVANVYRNDVSSARINNALQVVNVNGVPTCKVTVAGTDPSCVPYNIFREGGVTAAAANYIGIPLVLTGTTKQTVVNGIVTGDLTKYGVTSPFAENGVQLLLGAEYRREALATQPDLAYINGDGAGQGGPLLPISGRYSVRDLFTEVRVPLVSDRSFFQSLEFDLGYRNSQYSVQGANTQNRADTYKIEGRWAPVKGATLRGSFNRAVRSPNIGELFLNQSIGLFAGTDPCAGTPTATAAQCARTGVTAAQFGNLLPNTAQQYNQLSGGNLNLRPEEADTYTFGVVLQPQTFLNGLVFSVDYYNINVQNAIGGIGSQVILNQCIQTGDPFFCGKINRAPASAGAAAGSLWLTEAGFVDNRTTNTGSVKTSGIDINAAYRTDIGENKLKFEFVGTYLDTYIFQPLTNGFDYDCAGFYGITCGNPNPEFRFNTNVKWTFANDIAITARWRYQSSVQVDTISPDPDLASPGAAPTIDERLPSVSYFDLLVGLPVKDTILLRIGINNIFDKDPPLISQASLGGFGNGNTFPGTYDHIGRNIFINLTADF